MADLVEELRDECLKMMRDGDWPRWPVLPVKLIGPDWRVGLLVAGHGPKIYLKNLYDSIPIAEAEVIEFEDFPHLVASGWRVD